MKLSAAILFTALLLGCEGFQVSIFESEIRQKTAETYEEVTSALRKTEDKLAGLYDRAKTVVSTKNLLDLTLDDFFSSADDCRKLSNTSDLFVNATDFSVTAVERIVTSLDQLIDCGGVSFVDQLPCVIGKFQDVKAEFAKIQEEFEPYEKQLATTFRELVIEVKACI